MAIFKSFLLVLAIVFSASPAYAEGFFSVADDLPLMDGMTENNGAVVFESLGGRIIEVYAQGSISAERALSFYNASLPQLGWKKVGQERWLREGESLVIDIVKPSHPLVLRFSLSPE